MKTWIALAIAVLKALRSFCRKAFVLCLFMAAAFVMEAAVISENFSSNPNSREWRKFGNTNLFLWNASNQNLEVTWDSSQSNSYF